MSYSPFIYLGDRTKQSYTWETPKSTKDWAESNVRLNADTSPITGMLDMKYTPHTIEMLKDYDTVGHWLFVGVYSTQTAKSNWLYLCMSNTLDTKPCKMQFVIPNESGVETYISDKIEPFIRGVKSLNTKVDDYKSKEKQRLKKTRIKVAGGDVVFTGTSASSKRSKTVKKIFMDECDLFNDGDVIELMGRTKSFEAYGRKVVMASSQAKANGEISKAANSCDIWKEWQTCCRKCGNKWMSGSEDLKWMNIAEYKNLNNIKEDDFEHHKYRTEALKDVRVECPTCGEPFGSQAKNEMILNKEFNFTVTRGDIKTGKSFAYFGNALSMFFTSFETIASLLIDAFATGTYDDISQIYLDYFNEIYTPEIEETTSKNDILLLGNGLPEMIVPKDTVKLYLLVDTQKIGYWATVYAVQYGVKLHVVLARKLETFADIETLLGRVYESEDGKSKFGIDKMLMDRMGVPERTIEVDQFFEYLNVKLGLEGMVFPTIGVQADASGRLWYETTLTKELSTGLRRKTPIKAIKVNNTLVKNELSNLIQRSIKKANGEAGYEDINTRLFSVNQTIIDDEINSERSLSTDFSRQMTSEEYIYKIDKKTGKVATKQTWENVRQADNHYFDNAVLAVTATLMDNVNLMQKPSEDEDFDNMLGDLFS